jgi:hypothetical protein
VPRKYHRPPAVKRRKSRKTAIPYEPAPGEEADGASELPLDEETPLVAVDLSPDIPEPEDVPLEERAGISGPVRHVNRDYSYVRSEMVRIIALAAFLIVALAITAYFR